jgi:hypothetical protein
LARERKQKPRRSGVRCSVVIVQHVLQFVCPIRGLLVVVVGMLGFRLGVEFDYDDNSFQDKPLTSVEEREGNRYRRRE